MTIEQILFINLGTIGIVFLGLWACSLRLRDASIVDMVWGAGFVMIVWTSFFATGQSSIKAMLLTTIVSIWGLRLTGYLTWRNWGKPEDYRYAAMRERHGKSFPWVSLYMVFGLQGFLMWLISLPIQVGIATPAGVQPIMIVGLMFWSVGIFFETVGDWQLARFKADPANQGRVMNKGLWRYTRHPNYFGDFLVWWGFYLVAVDAHSWWWTIIGPVIMSFFLIRVSGVPMLESSLRSRVAGYDHYVESTSAFFPRPPRIVAKPVEGTT